MARVLARSSVVVPTIGRPSLDVLLDALAAAPGPRPAELIAGRRPALRARRCGPTAPACRRSASCAPAAAAPRGPATSAGAPPAPSGSPSSTTTSSPIPTGTSGSTAGPRRPAAPTSRAARAGCACRCPADRRPTDWERGTAGLATSSWITADLAYRRAALAAVGGFDERFPRAFREDSDLALRVMDTGARLVRGRALDHPPGAAGRPVGQRPRAGRQRRRRPHAPAARARLARAGRRPARPPSAAHRGHRRRAGRGRSRRSPAGRGPRRSPRSAWLAGTAEFAWARIAPGPRDRDRGDHDARSPARSIPPLATWHWLRGRGAAPSACRRWRGLPDAGAVRPRRHARPRRPLQRRPRLGPAGGRRPRGAGPAARPRRAGRRRQQPVRRRPRADHPRAGRRLHATGSTSCSARSTPSSTARTARTTAAPAASPRPGMVKAACAELDVDPARCVVIGDIGADVEAAAAAGAVGILVPTPVTRRAEVAPRRDRRRRPTAAAVDVVLGGGDWLDRPHRPRRPARQRRRRAAAGPAGPGRRRAAPTGSCSSPARPGPRPRALLPGVDEVWTWRCPWIARRPAAGRRRRPRRAHRRGSRALAPDEAVVSTSFHQSPLPLALLLRTAGRAAHLGDQRRLPRARCSTSGTAWTTTCPSPSGRSRSPGPPGSTCRPATTGGWRCADRCRRSRTARADGPYVVAPPRRLGAGARLAGRALRRGRRGAGRRRPPGRWSPAGRASGR